MKVKSQHQVQIEDLDLQDFQKVVILCAQVLGAQYFAKSSAYLQDHLNKDTTYCLALEYLEENEFEKISNFLKTL